MALLYSLFKEISRHYLIQQEATDGCNRVRDSMQSTCASLGKEGDIEDR
jgi:hypothetical protein